MAPKKQQNSSKNPNNQPVLSNDFYLLHLDNQKLTKEVYDLKQITQSLMLAINKLLNEKKSLDNKTSRYLLKRWKDKLLQSNGIQDKSLIRGSINLSKSNLIYDRIQNQEKCRIRSSPIRKQKKDVDNVKNMDIRQTNAIDLREHNIMKQKEELKIYLKSNVH